MKQCKKCNEWKRPDDFYKNKSYKDGLQSACKRCASVAQAEYYSLTREDQLARSREYRRLNKEEVAAKDKDRKCSEKVREAARRRYASDPEKYRLRQVVRSYGISADQYKLMFEEQQNRCKICGRHQSEFKKAFAVDHCHVSGKIRSLLCNNCNAGLGWFKDSPDSLRAAAAYVEAHQ